MGWAGVGVRKSFCAVLPPLHQPSTWARPYGHKASGTVLAVVVVVTEDKAGLGIAG